MKRDRLTILRSRHGVLAKTIRRRDQGELEIIGFSAGMWFSVEELEIGSLDELSLRSIGCRRTVEPAFQGLPSADGRSSADAAAALSRSAD